MAGRRATMQLQTLLRQRMSPLLAQLGQGYRVAACLLSAEERTSNPRPRRISRASISSPRWCVVVDRADKTFELAARLCGRELERRAALGIEAQTIAKRRHNPSLLIRDSDPGTRLRMNTNNWLKEIQSAQPRQMRPEPIAEPEPTITPDTTRPRLTEDEIRETIGDADKARAIITVLYGKPPEKLV